MEALIIAGAVRLGKRRATRVIEGALKRAEDMAHLGAFTTLMHDHALDRAQQIDDAIASHIDPGRLAGVPIAIKDNIAHAGQPLTAASKMLTEHIASTTATAVARLEAEGAIVIGRTNMDEFGMGSSGENSALFPTRNPVNTERVPGGSSSGSAAAVAAGIVPVALGSDTGGSVRQPASFCGIVGLKPSYGRISRSGLIAFGSSLDQIGPLTRSVRDAAVVTSIMAGADPLDSTALTEPMVLPEATANASIRGLKIGLPSQAWNAGVDPAVHEALVQQLNALESVGAELVEVDMPMLKAAIPTYYLLTSAEAASNLSRFDGLRCGTRLERDSLSETVIASRTAGFGPEVKRRILLGTFSLAEGFSSDLYQRANAVRAAMRSEFNAILKTVDVIATPTSPSPAFRLGEKVHDPVAMYLSDIYTTPPSLTGHPALSVPSGTVEGLPVGLQLIGQEHNEAAILTLGMVINGR